MKTEFERYAEIHQRMSALIAEGLAGSIAFQRLWRESEDIKNRHDGMPPQESKPLITKAV